MALPIKKKKEEIVKDFMAGGANINDLVANHPDEFTVRALWSSLTRDDVPAGHFGVQVKKEKTGETKFFLIAVEDFKKFVHPPVMVIKNASICKEWIRK